MHFEFKPEYETGIAEIDGEHRQFFMMINTAIDAIDKPEAEALSEARDLLDKLVAYAKTHLEHEEDYMRRTRDEELAVQVKNHDLFRNKIKEMTAHRDQLTLKDLGSIFIFMAKWLRGHIITMDMLIGKVRTTGRFVMTEDFMTGIEFVDEEHAVLFDIIGRVHDAIHNEFLHDRFDVIMEVLGELRDYTIKHFADEEQYMARINYSGLAAQKAVHEAFVDKITEIDVQNISDDAQDQNRYLSSLVEFLNDWLISHILKMDKLIPVEAKK